MLAQEALFLEGRFNYELWAFLCSDFYACFRMALLLFNCKNFMVVDVGVVQAQILPVNSLDLSMSIELGTVCTKK